MTAPKKRIAGWLVGVAVLAAGGGAAYWKLHDGADAAPVYTTEKVSRGNVTSTVTATGTLSARTTVTVGSQVSGRIQELGADFNDQVKKDQVIARIDPLLFQSEVEKARANLVSAQANDAKSRAALEDSLLKKKRADSLGTQGVLAVADVETATADWKSATAQTQASTASLSQARAALAQAQVNLKYTTIVSPIDGVIISRDVDVGQTVAASLQAPTLYTIAEDLRQMEVHTHVAESDVGRLRQDMQVTFTVDAFPEERFRGVVKQIRNAPTTVQNVVTYDAVIGVTNDDLKLRPGMTANVTFVLAEHRDALVVSSAALRFAPPEKVVATLSAEEKALIASAAQGRRGRGTGSGRGAGGSATGNDPAGAPGTTAATPPPSAMPREGSAAPAAATAPTTGAAAATAPGDAANSDAATGRRNRAASGGGAGAQATRIVWVLEAGLPHPRKVQIGISDGKVTEVVSGIAENDAVISGIVGAAAATTSPRSTSPLGGGGGPGGRMF